MFWLFPATCWLAKSPVSFKLQKIRRRLPLQSLISHIVQCGLKNKVMECPQSQTLRCTLRRLKNESENSSHSFFHLPRLFHNRTKVNKGNNITSSASASSLKIWVSRKTNRSPIKIWPDSTFSLSSSRSRKRTFSPNDAMLSAVQWEPKGLFEKQTIQ